MIRFALPLLLAFGIANFNAAQPTAGEAKGHSDLVHSVAFSPDNKTFATAGFDKAVKLWEYSNGAIKETKTLPGHTDPVYCVAFNHDGKWLASSSLDKTIRIWNVADGKQLQEIKGHTDIVDTIAFSPDSKVLASGGSDNIVKIWDVPGQKEVTQLKGHEMGVTGVVFTSNTTVVSISQDRTVRVWDLSIKEAPKKEEPKKEEPKKEDPKKDPKDKKDPPKDKKDPPKDKKDMEPKKAEKDAREVKKFGPTADDLYGVAWSKDAKAVVTAGYAGNISLWDLNQAKPTFAKKQKSLAYCITFSPDGKAALSGHLNGFVYVTPLTPGK